MDIKKYKKLFVSMSKFMASGLIATLIDIALFAFVFTTFLPVFESELLAGFCGMIVNFILQKKYVFDQQRKTYAAFLLYLAFSFIALFLGALLLDALVEIELLAAYIIIPKLFVIGVKFFFNYFTKRWVFEKKGLK